MAGLEGTINTPIGTVQKKTALIVGGGIAVLGFIVWYRQKSLGETGDALASEAIINPATGYPYGSPEDAAALAEQAGYVSPPTGGNTSGGSGGYPSNLGFATNGQWSQAVIEYMVDRDLVSDPSLLTAALGKYITGAYVTDAEVSLINQAIAVQGFPPIAGPNGYPPSLNRQTTPTTPTTPPPATVPTPAAPWLHHVLRSSDTAMKLEWAPAANAVSYTVYRSGGGETSHVVASGVKKTTYISSGLKRNSIYYFSVAGVNSAGRRGPTSGVVQVRTH